MKTTITIAALLILSLGIAAAQDTTTITNYESVTTTNTVTVTNVVMVPVFVTNTVVLTNSIALDPSNSPAFTAVSDKVTLHFSLPSEGASALLAQGVMLNGRIKKVGASVDIFGMMHIIVPIAAADQMSGLKLPAGLSYANMLDNDGQGVPFSRTLNGYDGDITFQR